MIDDRDAEALVLALQDRGYRLLDAGERFQFYGDGITPSVARVVEALDAERIALASAFGVDVPTVRGWREPTASRGRSCTRSSSGSTARCSRTRPRPPPSTRAT